MNFLFLGVAYEFPDSSGHGGTTTTSEDARKVFGSTELRQRLVNMAPDAYKAAYDEILFNDYILLRLISCNLRILPDKVDQLCKSQMTTIVIHFPWVRFPETIHEFYAHTAELIGEFCF